MLVEAEKKFKYSTIQQFRQDRGKQLDTFLEPVYYEICQNTSDIDSFSLFFKTILTQNELDEIDLPQTPLKKCDRLYRTLGVKNASEELFNAWEATKNDHIWAILYKKYGDGETQHRFEESRSTSSSMPYDSVETPDEKAASQPSISRHRKEAFSPSNIEPKHVSNTSENCKVKQENSPASAKVTSGSISKNIKSSGLSFITRPREIINLKSKSDFINDRESYANSVFQYEDESPPTASSSTASTDSTGPQGCSTDRKNYTSEDDPDSKKASENHDMKTVCDYLNLTSFYNTLCCEKEIKIKVKYIVNEIIKKQCEQSLKTIRLENIQVISPKRPKLFAKYIKKCDMPNLTEFTINDTSETRLVQESTLRSFIFFTTKEFYFDRSPTLCSVMDQMNTFSYKNNGVTVIHWKKLKDSKRKLVLHRTTFISPKPFYDDARDSLKAFSGYNFKYCKFSNFDLVSQFITELVLIKVNFVDRENCLSKFSNLTKLIIHIDQPCYSEIIGEKHYEDFQINLKVLLDANKDLKYLALRHVPLNGEFDDNLKSLILKNNVVVFYWCPLYKLSGIEQSLTDKQIFQNQEWEKYGILRHNKPEEESLQLIWNMEKFVDEEYYETFQMCDFFDKKSWNERKHLFELNEQASQ